VIVIEHNLDVVKSADWIIDLGPEGGDKGGTVVAEGTPEEVAANSGSYTGAVLAPVLGVRPAARADTGGRKQWARPRGKAASNGQRATAASSVNGSGAKPARTKKAGVKKAAAKKRVPAGR
jgi:excinuclease ABC subunit A